MTKIGFIGYGSMGSMIIDSLLKSNALNPFDIIISNRTLNKLEKIKNEYPEIDITDNNKYLASKCHKIFIFVGTFAVKKVIEDMSNNISPNTHIIHISAALTLKNVEKIFNGKITKVIPSLTSTVNEGVSLIHHNEKVDDESAEFVNKLFKEIGDIKIIPEDDFEICTDLTSCAPAFIASIFKKFAEAGAKHGNFTMEESEEMVVKTLYGTVKLLYQENMSFNQLISRVATKGGITEEGVIILEKEMPNIYDKIFDATLSKYEKIKKELDEQYNT